MDVNRLPQLAEAIAKAIPRLSASAQAIVKMKHSSEAGTTCHLSTEESRATLEMLRMLADASKRARQ